ncbi:MAG: ComF family protein [Elusimicrobiales bacterium]|nr:ComF family protein [Elusimicrobiales bacterium]
MFFLKYIKDIIFPSVCYCCRDDIEPLRVHPLCRECEKKFHFIEKPYCFKCGIGIKYGDTCYLCRKRKFNFDFSRSVFMYEEAISSLIKAYKYDGKDYLSKWFANVMIERLDYYLEFKDFDSITYVPISNKKIKERGFDQSKLIAEIISKNKNFLFIKDSILNTKNLSQVELSGRLRIENVRGKFIVKDFSIFKDRKVIIIDDVATTMSTLNEVSKIIKEAGAVAVSCFTIARQSMYED